MMFFFLLLLLQLLKFTLSTYVFSPTFLTKLSSFYPSLTHRSLLLISTITRALTFILEFIKIRIRLFSLVRFVRLSKSPYADAY